MNHPMDVYRLMFANQMAKPRFRNLEDANLFMECLGSHREFPLEKWVPPYQIVNGVANISKDYAQAPYELGYVIGPTEKLVTA
jgi:hypothetical protein